MADLEKIISDIKCQPKALVIGELMKEAVDTLTSLKLKLHDQCQAIQDFPKGEFYARRKPKGMSSYSSLEERLADDIVELSNCLDTGIVSTEVKNMFKATTVVNNNDHIEVTPTNSDYEPQEISSCSTGMLNRVSGWSGMKRQIASLQSGYLLLRDGVSFDIAELVNKVKDLGEIVRSQGNEIIKLKEENKRLGDICINYASSSTDSPKGVSKVHATAIFEGANKEHPNVNCVESEVQQNNRSNRNAYRSRNNNARRLSVPIIEATSTAVNTSNGILQQQRAQHQDTYADAARSRAAHLVETQHLQEKAKQHAQQQQEVDISEQCRR